MAEHLAHHRQPLRPGWFASTDRAPAPRPVTRHPAAPDTAVKPETRSRSRLAEDSDGLSSLTPMLCRIRDWRKAGSQ
jgi:hypothetical protein